MMPYNLIIFGPTLRSEGTLKHSFFLATIGLNIHLLHDKKQTMAEQQEELYRPFKRAMGIYLEALWNLGLTVLT